MRALGFVLMIPAAIVLAMIAILYARIAFLAALAVLAECRAAWARRRMAKQMGWASGWDRVRS